MNAVIQEFEERVAEVDEYLKLLARLENPDIAIFYISKRRKSNILKHGSLKVMKATVFLLIYNLVESAIRSGFRHLHLQIEAERRTLHDVRDELRRLWVGQQFDKMDRNSASPLNYRTTADKIVNEILQKNIVSLSTAELPVSGNLDANSIRKVCRSHGVKVKAHHRASGGQVLDTVRKQRNALGHGNVSFSECGKQYTVVDLERIKQESVIFVRSVLRNIQQFVNLNEYVA